MRRDPRLAAVCLGFLLATPVQAATEVGAVTRARGDCVGVSEGTTRSLGAGLPVFLAEEISTGEAARLRITFDDGTVLTLGERARVVIDSFVYQPDDGLEQLLLTATGPFRLATAALVSPAAVINVATPAAVLGVRGTDYWGGPIDGRYGVLVLEGVVTVANDGGEVVLSNPGEGTNLDSFDVAPGAVTNWPADKVQRALDSVSFN